MKPEDRLIKDVELSELDIKLIQGQYAAKYKKLEEKAKALRLEIISTFTRCNLAMQLYLKATSDILNARGIAAMMTKDSLVSIKDVILVQAVLDDFLNQASEEAKWNIETMKLFYAIVEGYEKVYSVLKPLKPRKGNFTVSPSEIKALGKKSAILFPNYQFCLLRIKDLLAAEEKVEKAIKQEQLKVCQPDRQTAAQAEEQPEQKTKQQRIADLQRQYALSEDFAERYNSIILQMEKKNHPNTTDAGKALEKYIDMILLDREVGDYFKENQDGSTARDENGDAILKNQNLSEKDIKKLEKKFANSSHYAYKVLDATEDIGPKR